MTADRPTIAVLSRRWWEAHAESSFVLRGVAAAVPEPWGVQVIAPGSSGSGRPDGLFDVWGTGPGETAGDWPEWSSASWPGHCHIAAVVVEEGDGGALRLAERLAPAAPVLSVVGLDGTPGPGRTAGGRTAGGRTTGPGSTAGLGWTRRPSRTTAPRDRRLVLDDLRFFVPVNPAAADWPHLGFGFTDYVLVLSDRAGAGSHPADEPTEAAAWMAARFPRDHLVVIEGGAASAWLGRACWDTIPVDTRTDLWRLMAHARAVVDLAPGALLGRECVESLRYATPIVAPTRTTGAQLARAGGGLWFDDVWELLGCLEVLKDPETRTTLGRQGQAWATDRFGDPGAFTSRLRERLADLLG